MQSETLCACCKNPVPSNELAAYRRYCEDCYINNLAVCNVPTQDKSILAIRRLAQGFVKIGSYTTLNNRVLKKPRTV